MKTEQRTIQIKLNRDQPTLIDLQEISKNTMQIMVLVSLIVDSKDDKLNELSTTLLETRDSKKSIFIYRSKINRYVRENMNNFNYTKVENGSILLTITLSLCAYKIFKAIHNVESSKDRYIEVLALLLKCTKKVIDSTDYVEEIIDIIIERYDNKFNFFLKNYEVDFMDSVG